MTQICIAAGTRSQSLNIIAEKIQTFYNNSAMVKLEIKELKAGANDPIVNFHNGSWIKIVTANDKARSSRANVVLVDEFRMVDLDVITKVLRKFLTTRRQPGFLKYEKYQGVQEPNTEIYLSSMWMKSHWSWNKFLTFVDAMTHGRKYFTCGFPYQLGVREGILDRQRILDEMSEEDFDWTSFSMEMLCLPFGESEKAYFKFEQLNKARTLTKPILPFTDAEFVQFKGNRAKLKFYKEKKANEIRILSMDIGLIGGKNNDATSFSFIRAIPNQNEYVKFVDYLENVETELTGNLALRAKQLFYDLECDYIVIDTAGIGLGVADECTKVTYDPIRGIEYPAWAVFNDEKMQERVYDKNALPIIFSIKVAGSTATATNHEMAVYVKTQFENKSIKLLCSDIEAEQNYIENNKKEYLAMSREEITKFKMPFINTWLLISEMINLETDTKSGFIKLKEPSGKRKDRYSSLAYGLYFLKSLEAELRQDDDNENELQKLISYYC